MRSRAAERRAGASRTRPCSSAPGAWASAQAMQATIPLVYRQTVRAGDDRTVGAAVPRSGPLRGLGLAAHVRKVERPLSRTTWTWREGRPCDAGTRASDDGAHADCDGSAPDRAAQTHTKSTARVQKAMTAVRPTPSPMPSFALLDRPPPEVEVLASGAETI